MSVLLIGAVGNTSVVNLDACCIGTICLPILPAAIDAHNPVQLSLSHQTLCMAVQPGNKAQVPTKRAPQQS